MATQGHLLIVGNGAAGNRLLEELARREGHGWRITVIGEEPLVHYNRIQLSPYLAGEISQAQLHPHPPSWYAAQGIDTILGVAVTRLDPARRQVVLGDGRVLDYDALVLATGSRPARPPLPETIEQGGWPGQMIDFRTLADTEQMLALPIGSPVVVLGGGLLGIEAAVGLAGRGHPVTLLHRNRVLMNRQLDATASELLVQRLGERGVVCRLGDQLAGAAPHQLLTTGGERLAADTLVLAIGISPEVTLARQAGLAVARAIVVNERLESSLDGIFALGECCEFAGETFGLVAPIWEQAQVLAARLHEGAASAARFALAPVLTRLKVSGVDIHSFGELAPADAEPLRYLDPVAGHYRALWVRDGVLLGGLLVGDAEDSQWYFEQVGVRAVQDYPRDAWLLGRAWAESA